MKSFTLLCILAAACLAQGRPQGTYTDKYDDIDLDEILGNKRLLTAYLKCILDKAPCTTEGKELRTHIVDALETDCSKCTEKQKNGTKRVLEHLIKNEKDYWKELTAKYDPKNVYAKKYEAEYGVKA